jgi:DNA-binding Xre family transcriptional regulator
LKKWERSVIIYTEINVYYIMERMLMVNYNKLMEKLKEKGITTYTIRQKALIPQGTLAKLKMCSGATMEEIEQKLQEYKDTHNGKDFMYDVSTKTIEDICQLLQCQPEDLIEWKVDLKPELAYETRFKE